MRFSYERIEMMQCPAFPQGCISLRPIILVTLEHQGTKRRYKALVDSGADFCIFHSLIGELLGLDVEKGKVAPFSGVGGNRMNAYFHNIRIHVGEVSHDLYCGFTRDIPPDGHGILGQMGFFDRFRVNFDYKQEEIEIIQKQ